MSKFVKQLEISGVFGAETQDQQSFKVTFDYLKRSDAVAMQTELENFLSAAEDQAKLMKGLESLQNLAVKYIKGLSGLKASDGSPVTIEEFTSALIFTECFVSAVCAWLNASFPEGPGKQ